MTEALPAPLTTPAIDVRDLDAFMLNAERLLSSELWALATGDEFKAAVGLWCRAWKQIPAGSLPDDHRILASFAGVTAARWLKVRDMALRGFVRCSDGRLYHRVLCAEALRSFGWKTARKDERDADLERKRREREDRAAMFDVLREAGQHPPWNTPTRDLRLMANRVTGHVTPPVTAPVTPSVTVTGTVKTGQDRTGHRDLERAALRALQAAAAGVAPPSQAGAASPSDPPDGGAPGPDGPAPRAAAAAASSPANPDAHPWLRAQLGKQGLAASPQATLEWEGFLKRIGVGKPKLVCEFLGWCGKRGDVQFARQAEPLVDEWRAQRPAAAP